MTSGEISHDSACGLALHEIASQTLRESFVRFAGAEASERNTQSRK
jgi:hypothetical protein